MTNKTERYFVVSESVLEAVCEANRKAGFTYQLDKRVQEAEAACRVREVKATFVVTSGVMKAEKVWVECLPDVTFLREDK